MLTKNKSGLRCIAGVGAVLTEGRGGISYAPEELNCPVWANCVQIKGRVAWNEIRKKESFSVRSIEKT